jgi:hypothetical protein
MNMGVIAVGVAIAAYGEVNFVVVGVAQQLSSLVFEATRLMLVQVLMNSQGMALNPIQSLYYVSPACLLCLSIPWTVLELPLLLEREDWGGLSPWVLLANAAAAFALNLAGPHPPHMTEWTWWAHTGGGNALAFKQPT